MRHYVFTFLLALLPLALLAQEATLRTSIANDPLPDNKVKIDPVTTFTGSMVNSGYNVGETIPDFTLYTSVGKEVNMRKVLALNKPLLLISGSYTCPSFRKYIDTINRIADAYRNLISIYVVYTVEAHPAGQTCPYMDTVVAIPENEDLGLLFAQPKTYGERKDLAKRMKKELKIAPEILVDGPANEWWRHFGLAPSKAYLINREGVIIAKCGPWIGNYKCSLWCKIDLVLHTRSGNCEH